MKKKKKKDEISQRKKTGVDDVEAFYNLSYKKYHRAFQEIIFVYN